MQYTTHEKWSVARKKNKLVGVTYTPEDVDFDIRLHDSELVPDNHNYCFRDFKPWLRQKTDFIIKPCVGTPEELHLEEYTAPTFVAYGNATAQQAITWQLQGLRKRTDCIETENDDVEDHPFKKLEELALPAGDGPAMETYNSIRTQWFESCLAESPWTGAPNGTYAGTTDSSVDIYYLNEFGDTSHNPANWHKHSEDMAAQLVLGKAATASSEQDRLTAQATFETLYAGTVSERKNKADEAREAAASQTGDPPPVHPWTTNPGPVPDESEDTAVSEADVTDTLMMR
jgi:hypothetical protein